MITAASNHNAAASDRTAMPTTRLCGLVLDCRTGIAFDEFEAERSPLKVRHRSGADRCTGGPQRSS